MQRWKKYVYKVRVHFSGAERSDKRKSYMWCNAYESLVGEISKAEARAWKKTCILKVELEFFLFEDLKICLKSGYVKFMQRCQPLRNTLTSILK